MGIGLFLGVGMVVVAVAVGSVDEFYTFAGVEYGHIVAERFGNLFLKGQQPGGEKGF